MSDYKKDFKQFVKKTEGKLSEGAKKGAEFAKKKAPKAVDFVKDKADKTTEFAKENASKAIDLTKKGAGKAADFAKKSAPVVKDFAKSVGEEIHDAGVEAKDFAKEKIDAYKNRNNIKVYTSSDVINYEPSYESNDKNINDDSEK